MFKDLGSLPGVFPMPVLTLARRQIQLAFEQSQKEVEDLH